MTTSPDKPNSITQILKRMREVKRREWWIELQKNKSGEFDKGGWGWVTCPDKSNQRDNQYVHVIEASDREQRLIEALECAVEGLHAYDWCCNCNSKNRECTSNHSHAKEALITIAAKLER